MPTPPDFKACFPSVSFGESSGPEDTPRPMRWGLWSPKDREWMQICEENYRTHHHHGQAGISKDEAANTVGSTANTLGGRPYRIPRTVHQIWLGSPLPGPFARLRESWQARHDGWELRLWTDADVEPFGLENKLAYDAAENFGQKSDILRYEILLREGGLYVDVDFLCLAAFDDLHRRYDFYSGISGTGTFELNNGLIGKMRRGWFGPVKYWKWHVARATTSTHGTMIATLLLSLAPSHTRRSRTRCRPGHPIMRDIIIRIRETCTPRDPKRTPNTAPEHTGGAPAAPTSSGISVAPHPSSSLGAAMATAAAEVGKEEEDRGSSSSSSGGGVGVDQLTALMAGVGGLGLEFGAGGGGGGGSANELMAGLLGDDDVARLQQAIKVEPGSATETIVKTGPGVFTAAVMKWMTAAVSSSATTSAIAAAARTESCLVDENPPRPAEDGAPSPPAYETFSTATLSTTMVFPPSYFYPVPNSVKGDLIGDGEEGVIRAGGSRSSGGGSGGAGVWLREESLAAHLWAKSWQG